MSDKEVKRIRRILNRLQWQREALRRQLDRAYLRDNITDYMAVESQYDTISLRIEQLLAKMGSSLPRYIASDY